MLHASKNTNDLYASIDIVSHKLAQALKKHNSRMREKKRKAKEGMFAEVDVPTEEDDKSFNEEDLLLDLDEKYSSLARSWSRPTKLDAIGVVRPKTFPMPPISVNEALSALELIDHPFYVFRNRETNEINVIYRRNHGGVGMISPQKL